MKATLLKMSVITTLAIFLFVGTSWADGGNNRHHKKVDKKHFRSGPDRNDGHQGWSHNGRGCYESPRQRYKKHDDRHRAAHRGKIHAFKHHRKYHRPVHKLRHHDHYLHKVIRRHYHKHKPSYNVFSYQASLYDPGWSVTIKTRSRR